MSETLFNRICTEIHLQKQTFIFVTSHMVPGAGAGDGISGGFHFPLYLYVFSESENPGMCQFSNQKQTNKQGFCVKKKKNKNKNKNNFKIK